MWLPFVSYRVMKGIVAILLFFLSAVVPLAVRADQEADSVKHPKPKQKMTITEVLAKHTEEWMAITGVVGTAEGRKNGKPCITIMVDSLTSALRNKLPKTADGYPVVIQETGEIKAR